VEACWVSEVQDDIQKELDLPKEDKEPDFDRGKASVVEEQSGYEDHRLPVAVAEDEEEDRSLVVDHDHSVGDEELKSDSVEVECSKLPIEGLELVLKRIEEELRLSDLVEGFEGNSGEVVRVVVELDFSGELERFEVPPVSSPNAHSHSSIPFHLKLSRPH